MNVIGVGAGVVLVSITSQRVSVVAMLKFFNSNNTAEYKACILGLKMSIEMDIK